MSFSCSTGKSTLTPGRFMFLRSPMDWSFSILCVGGGAGRGADMGACVDACVDACVRACVLVGARAYAYARACEPHLHMTEGMRVHMTEGMRVNMTEGMRVL